MRCATCNEEITGRPIKQGDEYFCSLECANNSLGWQQDEEENYYDENDLEGLYNEDEE